MNKHRAKVVLIPVLAVALYLVVREPSGETTDAPAARSRRPEIPMVEPVALRKPPRLRELSEIVSFDPFALRFGVEAGMPTADAAPPSATAVEAAPALPLRSRLRIDAIVKHGGAYHAVIGGKAVHPGDVIDDGRYRVTAISPHDVTVSRTDASSRP
jgi:hypothetical protein